MFRGILVGFQGVPGDSGGFRGVPGIPGGFRGVPGGSGWVSGFTDTQLNVGLRFAQMFLKKIGMD